MGMKINLRKNLDINKLKDLFNPSKPKWIIITIVIMAIVSILTSTFKKQEVKVEEIDASTDTYIPNGFVLVPLELVNAHTIGSLMASYTYVDLYEANEMNERKGKIIAQHLRMLKAPHDNNQFAVLVDENEHELIQQLSAPCFAVIKNPKFEHETVINKPKVISAPIKVKSRFSYGE